MTIIRDDGASRRLRTIAATLTPEQLAQHHWRVLRRGRPGVGYRTLYSGPNEARAREVFRLARTDVRRQWVAVRGAAA